MWDWLIMQLILLGAARESWVRTKGGLDWAGWAEIFCCLYTSDMQVQRDGLFRGLWLESTYPYGVPSLPKVS